MTFTSKAFQSSTRLRPPKRVQLLPQVILAGCEIKPDLHELQARSKELDTAERRRSTPLTEAINDVLLLVHSKMIQAEWGVTEDEAEMLAEEGLPL
jgi:hypothetical protein